MLILSNFTCPSRREKRIQLDGHVESLLLVAFSISKHWRARPESFYYLTQGPVVSVGSKPVENPARNCHENIVVCHPNQILVCWPRSSPVTLLGTRSWCKLCDMTWVILKRKTLLTEGLFRWNRKLCVPYSFGKRERNVLCGEVVKDQLLASVCLHW